MTHDGDVVGDLQHLVELVRDEDDGRAVGDEALQRLEELVDLIGHEHRGRLVEDEDLGAAEEHLEDLDPLALTDAELRHLGVEVKFGADTRHQLVEPRPGRPKVDYPAMRRFAPQNDVLEHREVVGEHEVLVHHADPGVDRVARRAHVESIPVDRDAARVRLVHPVEGFHEGRLPSAVLANDGVNRAPSHRQVDIVVGDHPGNRLEMSLSSTAMAPDTSLIHFPHADAVLAEGACRHCPHDGMSPGRSPGSSSFGVRFVIQATNRSGSGSGRDDDVAGHDLLLEVLELVDDVVDVATGGGVADAVVGQGERVEATGSGALLDVLGHLVHGDIDALEHRCQAVGLLLRRVELILVGVDADGPLAGTGLDRGLDHSATGTASSGVDHVRASVVPAEGDFLGLVGEPHAALSPAAPRYCDSTTMSGFTALAPAM